MRTLAVAAVLLLARPALAEEPVPASELRWSVGAGLDLEPSRVIVEVSGFGQEARLLDPPPLPTLTLEHRVYGRAWAMLGLGGAVRSQTFQNVDFTERQVGIHAGVRFAAVQREAVPVVLSGFLAGFRGYHSETRPGSGGPTTDLTRTATTWGGAAGILVDAHLGSTAALRVGARIARMQWSAFETFIPSPGPGVPFQRIKGRDFEAGVSFDPLIELRVFF